MSTGGKVGDSALAPELGACEAKQGPKPCSLSLLTGLKLSHPTSLFLGKAKWLVGIGVPWLLAETKLNSPRSPLEGLRGSHS